MLRQDSSRFSLCWLVAASSAPVVVALLALSGRAHWTLPETKLLILCAEYLWLAPAMLYLLRRASASPYASNKISHSSLLVLSISQFIAILLPLAYGLGLGRYQGDESAYLFAARCLKAGKLYLAVPASVPHSALQFAHHLLRDGRLLAKYPPGWPLLLSVATWLHSEWIANPLVGLVLLGLAYVIGSSVFDRQTAAVSIAVLAGSAFLLLNCLGFMSHVSSAVTVAGAVLCFTAGVQRMGASSPYFSGLILCVTATAWIRPFTALCAGTALVLVWTWEWKWGAWKNVMGAVALIGFAVASVLLCENYLLTGNMLKSAYSVDGQVREISLGIRDLAQSLVVSTPLRLIDTFSVSFPFVFPLALYGLWRERTNRASWGLFLVFASIVIGYAVEPDNSDSPIGERFYFEGYLPLCVLAARGLVVLCRQYSWCRRTQHAIAAALATVCLAVTAVGTKWEWELRKPSRDVANAFAHLPPETGVVFVSGTSLFPAFNWNLNDPDRSVLELIDPGPERRNNLARAIGAGEWVWLSYDPVAQTAVWHTAKRELEHAAKNGAVGAHRISLRKAAL